MIIRALTPNESEACYALYRRTVRGGTSEYYSEAQRKVWAPDLPRDADKWVRAMSNDLSLGAYRDETLVGFFTMGHDGHLDFAYVALEEMGKGTALALYQRCEDEAHRLGAAVMTTEASFLARKFFLKRGWEVEARQTVIRDGIGLDNFRMFKTL